MSDDRFRRWIEHVVGRWRALSDDWQGILVAAAIAGLISLFDPIGLSGITVPW